MGHTSWSGRIATDELVRELMLYGRALRASERELYEKLLKESFKHIGSISYASSMHMWAFLLLSIILEQEKRIKKLEDFRILARKTYKERDDSYNNELQ